MRLASIFVAMSASLMLMGAAFAGTPQPAPEAQGFSSERLARISAVMRTEIDAGTLPGAVTLIARNGKIVHFEAHGSLDAAKSKPMTQDAVFRAFSMTKPFVSVVAMMLVEQGRMKLSDPITTWIPEFKDMKVLVEKTDAAGTVARATAPAERPITVQDLLRHISGLSGGDRSPFPKINEAYKAANFDEADLSADALIQRLAGIPLAWQPGTHWQYGVSTDVLGVLLERLSGKRLDHLLDEMLFKPLQMKDTGCQVKPAQKARLAYPLESDPIKAQAWWQRAEADPGKRFRSGGGGAVTTAADYFRFGQMLVNGGVLDGARLLSRKTVHYMLSDHIPGFAGSTASSTGPGYGFGLGFAVRLQDGFATVPGSTGDAMWSGAGGTTFTIDPQQQIVGIFMAQAPATRYHLRFLFNNLLYGALVE